MNSVVSIWSFFEPFLLLFAGLIFIVFPFWKILGQVFQDSLERLVASAAASFVFFYLLEWGAYLLNLPQSVPAAVGFCVFLIASVLTIHKGRADSRLPWTGILTWAILAVWILGLQSQVVVYGGTRWYGDWEEHYERVLFFFHQMPAGTKFLGQIWVLPARAPLFNAAISWMMIFPGHDFWVYQILASLLNTFPVLPFALLIRDAAKIPDKRALGYSLAILAIAPFAVQQEIYPWTKFFSFSFVLAGIHFYCKGTSIRNNFLIGVSFVFFAIGMLAHYLVLLFLVFFMLHFLYTEGLKRHHWKLVLNIAIGCALLCSTWFGYCFATFGFKQTVTANSTFGDYIKQQQGETGEIPPWTKTFQGNLITTSIPYYWRHQWNNTGRAPRLVQSDRRGGPRYTPAVSSSATFWERAADLAQNVDTIPGAIGWTGLLGLALVLYAGLRNRRIRISPLYSSPGGSFWLVFFLVGIPLNILASRDYLPGGTAHLNLQPFVFLIAAAVVSILSSSSKSMRILFASLFIMESAIVTAAIVGIQSRPVPIVKNADGNFLVTGDLNFYFKYINNYMLKLEQNCVFLSDHLAEPKGVFLLTAVLIAAALAVVCFRKGINHEDTKAQSSTGSASVSPAPSRLF